MLPQAPALSAILESALYVDDLEAAEDFYGRVLGLEQIQRAEGRHVFFRCGGSVLLLFNPDETAKPPGNPQLPVPPHGARGPGHLCFAQPRAAMEQTRERLLQAGITIEAEFDWPGRRAVYLLPGSRWQFA